MENDNRLLWLRYYIGNLLGVYEPEYVDALISNYIEEFTHFLENKCLRNSDIEFVLLTVWRTYYDKMVEREITVLEEVTEPPPPPKPEKPSKKKGKQAGKAKGAKAAPTATAATRQSSGDGGTSIAPAVINDADGDSPDEGAPSGVSSVRTGAGGGKKGGKKKRRATPKRSIMRPPPPKYIEVKKIIQEYIKTPKLHCHFGLVDDSTLDPNIRYIYFLRKDPYGIGNYYNISEYSCMRVR